MTTAIRNLLTGALAMAGAAILIACGGPWYAWAGLLALALLFALWPKG